MKIFLTKSFSVTTNILQIYLKTWPRKKKEERKERKRNDGQTELQTILTLLISGKEYFPSQTKFKSTELHTIISRLVTKVMKLIEHTFFLFCLLAKMSKGSDSFVL